MFMKKSLILLSILSVETAFVGCNNLDPIDDPRGGNSELLPQTEVFFHGQKLAYEGQKPQAAAKAKIKITSDIGDEKNGAKSSNLTILYGHLQKTCNFSTGNAASIELEDGVETLTFKVTGPIPPAIISVTTEGETPTTSKIKVAQYLLAAPSSTAHNEAKESSKET